MISSIKTPDILDVFDLAQLLHRRRYSFFTQSCLRFCLSAHYRYVTHRSLPSSHLFARHEAPWRSAAGWLAGYIFDSTGSYTPAFLVGATFNVANLIIVLGLISRTQAGGGAPMRPVPV